MSFPIRPIRDRLVVKRAEAADKTPSGLIIPDKAKETPQRGVVMAIGSGRVLENGQTVPVDAKVGDTIVFGKYAGMDVGDLARVMPEAEGCIIIREEDILGVHEA